MSRALSVVTPYLADGTLPNKHVVYVFRKLYWQFEYATLVLGEEMQRSTHRSLVDFSRKRGIVKYSLVIDTEIVYVLISDTE